MNLAPPGTSPAENVLLGNKTNTEIHPGVYVAKESHTEALKLLSKLYNYGEFVQF